MMEKGAKVTPRILRPDRSTTLYHSDIWLNPRWRKARHYTLEAMAIVNDMYPEWVLAEESESSLEEGRGRRSTTRVQDGARFWS